MANERYLSEEELFAKPQVQESVSPGAKETKYLSEEELFPKSPMEQLEDKTRGGLKDLGKLPFWLAGQAVAFPLSGAAGLLGTIGSGGSMDYGQRAAAVIPEVADELFGSPITKGIEYGLHKASEAVGSAFASRPPSEVQNAQQLGGIKRRINVPQGAAQAEIAADAQREAVSRTVGENLIPAGLGASMVGGIRGMKPRPGIQEALDKLKGLEEKKAVEQGPQIPENVIPYSRENLPFDPRSQSDIPPPSTLKPLELSLAERDAILGQRNAIEPGELAPEAGITPPTRPPVGRLDFTKPQVAPEKPIRDQLPSEYITRGGTETPWELSGLAGSEGPRPMDVAFENLKRQPPERQLFDPAAEKVMAQLKAEGRSVRNVSPEELGRLYRDAGGTEMFTFDPTRALDFLPKAISRLTKKMQDQEHNYSERAVPLQEKIITLDAIIKRQEKQGGNPSVIEALKNERERITNEYSDIQEIYHHSLDILLAQRSMLRWKEAEQSPGRYHPEIKELMRQDMEWARETLKRRGEPAEVSRLPWGGEDITKLYTFDPMEAITKLFEGNQSLKNFERRLVDAYGEDIRPHAQTLYAAAKAQQREQRAKPQSTLVEQSKAQEEVLSGEESKDTIKWGGWDRRSGDQIKEDLLKEDAGIKDLDDGFWKRKKLGRLFTQGQKYARQHPVLNWVYSRMDWTERDINRTANLIMYGENFVEKNFSPLDIKSREMRVSSLRRASRDADPDSMMYKYNKLKDPEKRRVMEAGDYYNGVKEPTVEELQTRGLKQPEVEAYQNVRKGLDKMWDDVMVPMAEKVGIELPGKIPGYLPMSWFGDYRVWGKHRETGERMARGVNSLREANAVIKEMRKTHPEWEFSREDVTNIHKEFTSTPDAFLDAIKLFGRNSEAGKLLYDAMGEVQMRRGASKHRLARNPERTRGYAGDIIETGKTYSSSENFGRDKALVNFERSLENYVETGVRYAKNKELNHDIDQALKDPKFISKFPNSTGLAENMRDSYLGADKFLDTWINKAMIDLGQSTNLPRTTLSTLAGAVMLTKVMALRAPFYLAQAVQDVMILPRMLELKAKGLDGNITEAILKGHVDWMDGSRRVEDIRWAVKYAVVDPKFAEQITFIPNIRGKKPNLTDMKNTLSGNRASAGLDQSVRLKSYLMLLNFAESAGLKGQAAREVAARHSLDTMVEYEAWKRAPIFRDIGQVGGVFSPLTTFTSNLLNRLADYGKMASKGSVKPLAAIIGTYLFLSGMNGVPFRQDIDNAIDAINERFDMNIPTPTDWMIENSAMLGDVGLFGVPSGVSGWQVGGSLGSPEIIGSLLPGLDDPAPKFLTENVGNAISLGSKALSGQPVSESEKMQAFKGAAPTAPGHGMIENYFSPQNTPRTLSGMFPQDTSRLIPDKNMEGGYRRSPAEQVARVVGVRSTDESLEQMKRHRYQVKTEKMETQRRNAITSLVDGISTGNGIKPDSIQRFIKNGGDPSDLINQVENKVMDRLMDFRTRELKGLSQQEADANLYRKVKLLEEFKLLANPKSKHSTQTAGTSDARELELRELDMQGDLSSKQMSEAMPRLQQFSDLLDKHMDYKEPRMKDVRRKLLETSGVLGGDTNFSAEPYKYMHPDTRITNRNAGRFESGLYGQVNQGNPYEVRLNPDVTRDDPNDRSGLAPRVSADYGPGMLAHEANHGLQFIHDARSEGRGGRVFASLKDERMDMSGAKKWFPNFTQPFLIDLVKVAKEKEIASRGLGIDPYETMAILTEREASLRKGQSLRDDPVLKNLWKRYPSMWEEYARSRNDLARMTEKQKR